MNEALLFNVAAVGVAMVALGLGLWGLHGDPSRGRRRCPRCWYDLGASDGLVCSECGYTARRERALHRARRGRPAIAAGLALVPVVMLVAMLPGIRRHGWVSSLPDAVLMRFIKPEDGGPLDVYDEELRRRVRDGLLATRYYMWLIERAVDDGSPPWSIAVRMRDRWPEGEPVHYEVAYDRRPFAGPSWMWSMPLGLSVTPPSPNLQLHTDFMGGMHQSRKPGNLSAPPAGKHEIQFDVSVVLVGAVGGAVIWNETQTCAVAVGGAVEDVLEVIRDPPLEAHFGRYLSIRVNRGKLTPRGLLDLAAIGASVTIGGELELRQGEQIVRRFALWRDTAGAIQWTDLSDGAIIPGPHEQFSPGEWVLHYRSDPSLALRHLDATHYWAGDFTLPMQVVDGQTLRHQPLD